MIFKNLAQKNLELPGCMGKLMGLQRENRTLELLAKLGRLEDPKMPRWRLSHKEDCRYAWPYQERPASSAREAPHPQRPKKYRFTHAWDVPGSPTSLLRAFLRTFPLPTPPLRTPEQQPSPAGTRERAAPLGPTGAGRPGPASPPRPHACGPPRSSREHSRAAPAPPLRHVTAAGLAPAGAAPPVTGSRGEAAFPPPSPPPTRARNAARHAPVRWRGGGAGGPMAAPPRQRLTPAGKSCERAAKAAGRTGHRCFRDSASPGGWSQLPRHGGGPRFRRRRLPSARVLPAAQPPPRAVASPPRRGPSGRSSSQHRPRSGKPLLSARAKSATPHAQSRAGERGPRPRDAREAPASSASSASPQLGAPVTQLRPWAQPALLLLLPRTHRSRTPPPPPRRPVFKGAHQTCWRWVIEKLPLSDGSSHLS